MLFLVKGSLILIVELHLKTKYSQNSTDDCDLHAAYLTLIVMLVKTRPFHRQEVHDSCIIEQLLGVSSSVLVMVINHF